MTDYPTPESGTPSMSEEEAEAALAPLETAVRADRQAQQTGDQADTLREQLLDALDSTYCRGLGYATPEDLLGAYEISRWAALVGEADQLRREGAALNARVEQVDDQVNTLRRAVLVPEPTDQAAVQPGCPGHETAPNRCTCPCEGRTHHCGAHDPTQVDEQPAPTTADPAPLRWGLDDIEHGDDDSVTVLLSGPDGRPYRLELDPGRAVALRGALAGFEGDVAHVVADDSDDPEHVDDCPGCGPGCSGIPGIRGLLEHVGIDTTGRDITVAGRVVDKALPTAGTAHAEAVNSPARPLTPEAVNAIVRDMDDPRYPTRITVHCDRYGCGVRDTGEYLVEEGMSSEERLAVARRHLVENAGWGHTDEGDDLCPEHARSTAQGPAGRQEGADE